MKLTKKQKEQLYNSHIGVGFIAFKSAKNTLNTFEFYLDGRDKIRFLTSAVNSPEVNINKQIIDDCIFEKEIFIVQSKDLLDEKKNPGLVLLPEKILENEKIPKTVLK